MGAAATGAGQQKGNLQQAKMPGIPSIFKKAGEQALKQQRFFFGQQKPIAQQLASQTLEALTTGGVGARIPIVQRGVEAAKRAGSEAVRQTEETIGAGRLGGTPFGQSILAQTRQRAGEVSSLVPVELAQQFIAGAPALAGQLGGFGAGLANTGLSGLASLFGQNIQSIGQMNAAVIQAIGQAASSAGSAGACDRRVKREVRRIGRSARGFGIYRFRYVGSPHWFTGPLAQDVQARAPEAVVERNGLLYVRLDRVDVPLRRAA